jgi:hypothetical protein
MSPAKVVYGFCKTVNRELVHRKDVLNEADTLGATPEFFGFRVKPD